MGRKPKPLNQRSGNKFAYQYPLDDPRHYEAMQKFHVISRREQRSLDELHAAAVVEYVDRHYYGNYQTLLPSYEDGGQKSMGQLEAEIVRYFTDKAVDQWEVYYRDIVAQVRSLMSLEGGKAAQAAERIVGALHEARVRVIK